MSVSGALSSVNGACYEGVESDEMPFEFICLEFILMAVCRNLEARFDVYAESLLPLLVDTPQAAEGATLMHLLQLKHGQINKTSQNTKRGEFIGVCTDI